MLREHFIHGALCMGMTRDVKKLRETQEQSAPDVQRHAAGIGQGLEEVLHQLSVKGANAL